MHEAKADIEPGCRRPRACLHVLIVDVRCVQLPPPTLHDCGKRKTIVTHQSFCVSVRNEKKKGPLSQAVVVRSCADVSTALSLRQWASYFFALFSPFLVVRVPGSANCAE